MEPREPTDEEDLALWARAASDEAASTRLAERVGDLALRILGNRLTARDSREDLKQEIVWDVLQKRKENWAIKSSFPGFLRGRCLAVLKRLRRGSASPTIAMESHHGKTTPSEEERGLQLPSEANDLARSVDNCLGRLDQLTAEILRLTYWGGLSAEAVRARLGLAGTGAVYSRLSRGRQKLKVCLLEQEKVDPWDIP